MKTQTFTALNKDPIRGSLDIRAETQNTPFSSNSLLQLKHTNHVLEDSFIRLSENISSYNQNAKKKKKSVSKTLSIQKCREKRTVVSYCAKSR